MRRTEAGGPGFPPRPAPPTNNTSRPLLQQKDPMREGGSQSETIRVPWHHRPFWHLWAARRGQADLEGVGPERH